MRENWVTDWRSKEYDAIIDVRTPSEFEDGQEDAVGIFIVVLLQIAFVFSLVAAGLSIMDNASAIEADVGNDGWNDDEVDQRTYKEKLISTYHDQKYKLSLHHMTGGLLGKMSKSHPDYITRIKLIEDFVNKNSFHKKEINNASAPLRWEYNRRENWLKFYPNQINK